MFIYRATRSVSSITHNMMYPLPLPSHRLTLLITPLLGGDLAVVLDVDVLVGGEGVDLVVGERGAEYVSVIMIKEIHRFARGV
jgi:hypothetical protein